jgi:hypothetical protein
VAEPTTQCQQIHIKEEVNSDDEDNETSQKLPLNNLGLKNEGPKLVKKELTAFDGLPKKLHIQPLPEAPTEGFFDEHTVVDEEGKSRINFRGVFKK